MSEKKNVRRLTFVPLLFDYLCLYWLCKPKTNLDDACSHKPKQKLEDHGHTNVLSSRAQCWVSFPLVLLEVTVAERSSNRAHSVCI